MPAYGNYCAAVLSVLGEEALPLRQQPEIGVDLILLLKSLIGVLFQVALFAALLLIPAVTWDWPRAIQFLVVYGVVLSVSAVLLAIFSPASLEARLEAPVSTKQPIEDRVATVRLIVVIAAWFIWFRSTSFG